jgi:CRP/FNR family transcriptional regulator, dissimilatory nitrate respiration regulator
LNSGLALFSGKACAAYPEKRSGGIKLRPIEAFAQSAFFRGLSLGEIAEVVSQATTVAIKKGGVVFNCGDRADFLYLVQEGMVKLGCNSPSGKEAVVYIAIVGDTLNATALHTGVFYLAAEAITDATLLRIDSKQYLRFVKEFPNLSLGIINVLASRLKTEWERMVYVQREDADVRVSEALCQLGGRLGPTFSIPRQILADYVGLTVETTIRTISKLKKRGLIASSSRRGELVIINSAGLQEIAGKAR